MDPLIIVVAVIAIVGVYILAVYNGLITTRNRVKESWSGIDVQLKRRTDLIPNLIEAVKGYAKHEKSVFENVTKARSALLGAKSAKDAAQADNILTGALKSLFAVAEAYPQLRATENFQKLQDEVTDTEDKIQAARRFYNGGVRDLNTKIQTFPINIFAGLFSFKLREFFEVGEGEAVAVSEPVKVSFDSNK